MINPTERLEISMLSSPLQSRHSRRAFLSQTAVAAGAIAVGGILPRIAHASPAQTRIEGFRFVSGGQPMVGDLHLPAGQPLAVAVMCGAWTSVKEQATGAYARALAERGYAALAFDHRYFGQSGGEPRQLEKPTDKVQDVRNAVGAVIADEKTRELPVVVVGICAGGGYALRAVAGDERVRAFAGVAGAYSDAALMRARMGEAFDQLVARGRAAEEKWQASRIAEMIPAVAEAGGDVAMPFQEGFAYYGSPDRGAVPTYVNRFAVQSYAHVLTWDAIGAAPSISIPVLIVHSDKAALPDLARRVLAEVRGPAKDVWLNSRNHVDFYDSPELIASAADAMADHFRSVVL
jgi:fermentation-respiration switch protein FrsA (DUF1100 family)